MENRWATLLVLTIAHATTLYGLVTNTDSYNHDFFSLSTTGTWREYYHDTPDVSFFKEKWAWASSLTLKSKKPIKLTTLILQWQGPQIDNLAASLYQKKERESSVIPIQKNLVCDGIWQPTTQKLIFRLDEKIVAVNKYHLLLSYPKHIELLLKNGTFLIADMQTTLLDKKKTDTLQDLISNTPTPIK